jgi:molybdate transport system permease protein
MSPRPERTHEPVPLVLWLASAPLVLYIFIPLVALLFVRPPHELVASMTSDMALRALGLTLRTTLVATLITAVIGAPVAYLLARGRFRGHDLLDTLLDLPVTVPPVVVGVALLLTFGRLGLIGRHLEAWGLEVAFTTIAVVMAQVFIACPFFVKAARAGFESVDARLESAARTLGASPWRVFWTITVPLAWPALLSGTVLAWARALSEFGATMMFAGNFPGRTQTLALAVMSALESDLGTATAVSVLSLGLALLSLLLARVLVRRLRRAHA